MPFALISDTFADDPIWEVLAGEHRGRRESIKIGWVDSMTEASRHRTDGYLTREMAQRCAGARAWVIEALTTAVLGRPPRWHQQGDECPCLGADDWQPGYAYRIHKFLKRNPSRAENDLNRQQKADLRDARLKALVYARDGGCCRYCGSGPLSPKAGRSKDRRKILQFDHVDPDAPAGADGANLVVACARCNEHKGHRTPAEADMVLLPAPADPEALRARDLVLLDPEQAPINHRPISDESATDHRSASDSDGDPISDHQPADDTVEIDNTTTHVRLKQEEQQPDQRVAPPAKGLGWVGHRPDGAAPAQPPNQLPARPPEAPDIYHRRSRAAPQNPTERTDRP